MIDPLISLSFSLNNNKGTYALLLGSGLSRGAGIPTGWEITLDVISKVAKLMGEDCGSEPKVWYRSKFGKEPNYSELLNEIAKTPSERNQLLRGYFEPSQEDEERGFKTPTLAHKIIAKFVAEGIIKVIITTNFDRLIEKAIEAVGVTPLVISTDDAIQGAVPLIHTRCTVIKVNGDYLDTRIKNTPEELAKYGDDLNNLMDKILDEFGLIVCGWSAEWDIALRACLERCKNHRFTTYWTVRGEPTELLTRLTVLRRAEMIRIKAGDDFFKELGEKTSALSEIEKPHPISAKIAMVNVKKYLVEPKKYIELHDLIMRETEKAYQEIASDKFSGTNQLSDDSLRKRIREYESAIEILQAIIMTVCFWGERNHVVLLEKCLKRIASRQIAGGIEALLQLRQYPSLLLLYAGGIAALANGKYENMFCLLKTKTEYYDAEKELVEILYPEKVLEKNIAGRVFNKERHHTPFSEYLEEFLREPLREYIQSDKEYRNIFDRFEYILALEQTHRYEKRKSLVSGFVGCFGWRNRTDPGQSIIDKIKEEAGKSGNNWPLLKAGFFDNDVQRFIDIGRRYKEQVLDSLNWY